MKTLLVLIMLCPFAVKADTNKVFEYAAYATTLGDYFQTRDIIQNPNYIEANPVLGKYPTLSQLNWFFGTQLLTTYLMQSSKYALYWNMAMSFSHGNAIIHNYNLGVKFRF